MVETTSVGHSERKKTQKITQGRDFHLPELKSKHRGWRCWRSQSLCEDSVEYPGAGGREFLGHGGAELGKGIWEGAELSLTAQRGPDVFIIMEKICWCLFAQRNIGGGNVLLSSDQGWTLKPSWAGVRKTTGMGGRIFSASSFNLRCEGAPKSCSSSSGTCSQTRELQRQGLELGPEWFLSPLCSLLPLFAAGAAPGMSLLRAHGPCRALGMLSWGWQGHWAQQ